MSSSSPEYKLNDSDEDLYDMDKIHEIKNEISMFQQQNESLKKKQEKLDEIERNFLMQQKHGIKSFDEDVDVEKFNDPPKLLSFPNISMNQKEYEQFIVEDADLDEEEGEDEEDEYSQAAYLEAAKEKIKKLETQVLQYRKIVHEDERYIQDLEAELELYQAPKRRIQSLENQLENARHQCINLTSQFRANETTQMQKQQAYDSMKEKFLNFVTGTNKEKEELKIKLEAKEKENQTLIAIIAHLQAATQTPIIPAGSQNTDTMSSTNTHTTTTDELMDLTSAPPTPGNVIATVPKDGKKSNESSPDLCF